MAICGLQEGSVSGSFGGLSSCSTPLGIEVGDEQRSRKHKVRQVSPHNTSLAFACSALASYSPHIRLLAHLSHPAGQHLCHIVTRQCHRSEALLSDAVALLRRLSGPRSYTSAL